MDYSLEITVAMSIVVSGLVRFSLRKNKLSIALSLAAPFAVLALYLLLQSRDFHWEPGLSELALGFWFVSCLIGAMIGTTIASLLRKTWTIKPNAN